MSRAKKDGKFINYYVDRQLVERLVAYAADKGQTVTTALERILQKHLDEYDASKSDSKEN